MRPPRDAAGCHELRTADPRGRDRRGAHGGRVGQGGNSSAGACVGGGAAVQSGGAGDAGRQDRPMAAPLMTSFGAATSSGRDRASAIRALAITVSNRAAAGVYEDSSGPLLVSLLRSAGCRAVDGPVVVPDGEPVEAALHE